MTKLSPTFRYGLRVTLTPWLVFVFGLLFDWPLSFVGAVFTSLFILAKQPTSQGYGFSLVLVAYVYMLTAWFVSVLLRPYPAVYLLVVLIAVVLSYYVLVTKKDILVVVMALLGALLIPLQAKVNPDVAWGLAIWLPNNLFIALLACWAMFMVIPPEQEHKSTPSPAESFDPKLRWLRLSIVVLPFVMFAFITDRIEAFTLTYLAVQVTQFAASSSNGPSMIRAAIIGNILGGLLAVVLYELVVIAPFFPFLVMGLLLSYAYLTNQMLTGNATAITAMTAFTVVCGVSFGPLMNDAEGKILLRMLQIAFSMSYIFIAMWLVDKFLPEK